MQLKFALIGAAVALAAATGANATVYTLTGQTVSPATATGTITTDGTLGVIGASNITAIDVTVTDGLNTATLDSPAEIETFGTELVAAGSGLYFNYGATDSSYFVAFSDIGTSAWCMTDNDSYTCSGIAGNLALEVDSAIYQGPVQSGDVEIATAVPEPAAWALMLAGFGAIGGVLRMGRRRVAIAV